MKFKLTLKYVAGALLIVLAAAAITYGLLTALSPKEVGNEEDKPATTVASAKDIIDELRKPETITGLDGYKEAETPLSGLSDINYTKANSYRITTPASEFVQYEHTSNDTVDNPAAIITSLETFLTQKGLTKQAVTSEVYTIFDSDQTTCQLVNLPKMGTRPAMLTAACVPKEVIAKTYESIDKLLALYTKASKTNLAPTTIQEITDTDGNKTLTTLNAYGPGEAAKTLLFAAVNEDWEYLGERPLSAGTTEANPTGINRELSSELKLRIADPKYEGFLESRIR